MVLDYIDYYLCGIYFSEFVDACSRIFQAKWQSACYHFVSVPYNRLEWRYGYRTSGSEDGSFYRILFVWTLVVELSESANAAAKIVDCDASVAGYDGSFDG